MSLKAKDKNGITVYIDNAKRDEAYYCPICGQQVMQKRGEIRIHHFAHFSSHHQHGKYVPCSDHWGYDMSEWHLLWQKRFPIDNIENVVESNNKKHIADLLIGDFVVEFQHSPISIDEFNERNKFYTSLGYKVIWLFDLIEDRNNGRLSEKQYEYYYSWAYAKRPFKDMRFEEVKATIYFQMSDCEDNDTFVIERVADIRENGKWLKTDEKCIFSIQEFVEKIKTNSVDLFPKPKHIPAPQSLPGCRTIAELWDESFSSMIVKNEHTGTVMYVFGRNGKLLRDFQTHQIRCRYAHLDYKTGHFVQKGDFYNVFDENKRIWTQIHSFKDVGFEKRTNNQSINLKSDNSLVAKEKIVIKQREESIDRDAIIKCESSDCDSIYELTKWASRKYMIVKNNYTKKTYSLEFVDIENKLFNIYEVDSNDTSKKLSEALNYQMAKLYGYKIWIFIKTFN